MKKENPHRILRWLRKYRAAVMFSIIVLPFAMSVSFYKIMDKTVKKRSSRIEFLVVHYTANNSPGATARRNAMYLRNKKGAGTHYCIDDGEIVQCTEEGNVAYAVGDKKWWGFVAKPWLDRKIKNNNSLSFEMCLGGGRNDSLIIETTAQQLGWQLVNKGLDISRVVRHHDVSGKHCPKFYYSDNTWNQAKEDRAFYLFKLKVQKYQNIHLYEKKRRKEEQEKLMLGQRDIIQ